MQDTTASRKPNRPLTLVLLFVISLLLVGSATGIYVWQHSRTKVLRKQATSLQTQLTSLQQQTVQLQAARAISTSNWKVYCDPHANFCFKYPSGWSITSNYASGLGLNDLGMGSASLKNSASTLTVSYLDDYIKDDTGASFVVHSVSPLSGAGKNLLAVGGYFVSSGGRTPIYMVVNAGTDATSPALSNKPGQTILAPLAPVFQYSYGNDTPLGQFVVQGKSYPTTQQADAWFDSIDGLTALQMIDSFTSGSTYTGKYLDIPELGLRMKLTYNTQDAYYVIHNATVADRPPFVILSVHSLDAYSGCTPSKDNDGIAVISTFTKGETDPVYGDYMSDFPNAPQIGGLYYFVARGQYDCTLGNASALLSDASHDFVNAYSTIKSTNKP